jgi:acetolactate synthase-1/2/3 large subunit
MGYALPAAIGAQMGKREEQVWVTVGDGGFQMNIQELATVAQEKLPLKIAILNNGYLGMVRQWQQLFFEGRYSGTPLLGPDFAKVAEAYGITGITVREKGEVVPVIERALATDGPVLIDFVVEQEENVYPMVAPGASVSDMIRRPMNNA